MQEDRRKERRVEIYTNATIVAGSSEFFGYVHNLSKEGLGLFCRQLVQIRDPIEIKLELPKKAVVLKGTVIWRLDNPDHEKGPYQYGINLEEKPIEYDLEVNSFHSETT